MGLRFFSSHINYHNVGARIAEIMNHVMNLYNNNNLTCKLCWNRCLAYGMPGAMVTEGIAEYCKPFMTSFVLGRDIVPRLSFGNLRKIRDDVLDLIARCKVNKTKVLHSLTSKDPDILEKFLYPPGKEPDSDFRRQLKVCLGKFC